MADKIWTVATTAGIGAVADQAMIDNLPDGARNQAIVALGSLAAGIAGRFALKRYPKVQHATDGLLALGFALGGQSGMHYVDNSLISTSTSTSGTTSTSSGTTSSGTSTSSSGTTSTSSGTTSSDTSASSSGSTDTTGYGGN